MTFKTIAEVKALNQEVGHFFFSPSTMAFFDSKIESDLYGGRFFITSEQFHGSTGSAPRTYSVRRAQDNGTILTVARDISTIQGARLAARNAVRRENDEGHVTWYLDEPPNDDWIKNTDQ